MHSFSLYPDIPYQTFGEGQRFITLLNGFMRPQKDFGKIAKILSKEGFKVITMDFRGSGSHTVSNPFSIQDLASDVERVWSKVGVKKTALIGISMGGIVAQELLHRNKDILNQVTLVSTSRSIQELRKPSPNWEEGSANILQKYVSTHFNKQHKVLIQAMGKAMDTMWQDAQHKQAGEWQRHAIQNWVPPNKPHASIPVCVLHGSEDLVFPISSAIDLSKNYQASMHIFDGHGHLLIAESPQELYAVILEQLSVL
ncbi:MAG: alpha/beta fold hydrolase [Oligoflexales bacterium]